MPVFEFGCIECGSVFEKLLMNSDEKVALVCPECHSHSLERVVSRTNYTMGVGQEGKKATITRKSCGSSNECTTLELPGHSR